MDDFETAFLAGFAWLLFHDHATLRIESEKVALVGLLNPLPEGRLQEFPEAARLAYLAVHDSLGEIRSLEGGSGMNQIYKLLGSYVHAGALLFNIRALMDQSRGEAR